MAEGVMARPLPACHSCEKPRVPSGPFANLTTLLNGSSFARGLHSSRAAALGASLVRTCQIRKVVVTPWAPPWCAPARTKVPAVRRQSFAEMV